MEEAEGLELYDLHYSDFISLSSTSINSNNISISTTTKDHIPDSQEELERLESIRRSIMEALGPTGPGLLCITAVPNASLLRQSLLPLARKLALLDPEHRKRILKEHNLGSDVPLKNPGRNVSSFAMQLKYDQALEFASCKQVCSIHPHSKSEPAYVDVDREKKFEDDEFRNLAKSFRELGYCMMELGLRLAQICDKAYGGQELERSLLESGTAKGRLIHYHSHLDKYTIKETERRKGSTKKQANFKKNQEPCLRGEDKTFQVSNLVTNGSDVGLFRNHANLWQQWHYDYGIFTVLTAPMFLMPSHLSKNLATDQHSLSCDQECPYPSGNSYLEIFNSNKNKVLMVKTSPESFIIQVGESADILSRGKLRATLHCVCRPAKLENLCRETFVVFLQPAWGKTFSISDLSNEGNEHTEHELDEFTREIKKIVPPLSLRLKDGMTFAEFARETTKQYYGGSGLQSKS